MAAITACNSSHSASSLSTHKPFDVLLRPNSFKLISFSNSANPNLIRPQYVAALNRKNVKGFSFLLLSTSGCPYFISKFDFFLVNYFCKFVFRLRVSGAKSVVPKRSYRIFAVSESNSEVELSYSNKVRGIGFINLLYLMRYSLSD